MVACDLSVLKEGWKLGNTRGCQLEGDQLESGLPLTAYKGSLLSSTDYKVFGES
jgi:hypothetical protein